MSHQGLKEPVDSDRVPQPTNQPSADASYTTVYTFVIYDHDKGATAIYPRMATRRTIANMRGKVNEETAWVVEVAELDAMGFYVGEKAPERAEPQLKLNQARPASSDVDMEAMTEDRRYTIRPATVSDAAVIAGHRVAMFRDMGQVPTDESGSQLLDASTSALAELLREGTYIGYLAVGADQQVIGGAGVHVRTQLPRISGDGTYVATRPVPLLVNVYTEPQWRRRGIARELVATLMRRAAEEGADQIVLHASDAGRALYESLGFAATNEMRWSPPRAR